MRIHAITCSVNFADYLEQIVPHWKPFLASWTIVTDTKDHDTAELARKHNLFLWRTDKFYANGATFNKGAAMEQCRIYCLPRHDWLLLLDADMIPERGWFERLQQACAQPGKIYSAWRYQCTDLSQMENPKLRRITEDAKCVGYFQLFHQSDPRAQIVPLIPTHWGNASAYDCELKDRWPHSDRRMLSFRLFHVGSGHEWMGRGNAEGFRNLMAERERLGGHQHERITV